jgi:hypothetical protein
VLHVHRADASRWRLLPPPREPARRPETHASGAKFGYAMAKPKTAEKIRHKSDEDRNDARLTIRLTKELRTATGRCAARDHRTVSNWIVKTLTDAADQRQLVLQVDDN